MHKLIRLRRERWELWRNTTTRMHLLYTAGMTNAQYTQVYSVLIRFIHDASRDKMENPMLTDLEVVERHPAPSLDDMIAMLPRPAPPPKSDLDRIARDSQNVHTAAVSEQTNRGIEILMKVEVPADQETFKEIRAAWDQIYTNPKVSDHLYVDMVRWWNVKSCIKQNDLLYHKLLRRVWARIKLVENAESRRHLVMRLQEECAESYSLCCAGHINRLVNVMVGFDDAFRQDVPKNIILQEKFAKIADIEDEVEKFRQATEVIAELGLTSDEAAPWLDAISN